MTRIHLIGVCGTAMATLAALLKSRGHDVRGSDQNVYPPMSDFLEQQGITLSRATARAHHRRPRPRRRRQRDLARQPGARGGARSQDPLLLAARSRARSLPVGRALDRHRRHPRQDDDDVADRVGAGPRRRGSRACSSAASPRTSTSSYRIGGGREFVIEGDEYDSAFFDKTAKFLKYLPDIAVVNNIEYDHADIYPDLAAIRLAFQRFVNLDPAPRAAAARRRQRRGAGAAHARALPRRDIRPGRRRRLAGARSEGHGDARPRSACAGGGAAIGHLRSAAARRLQRPQRARGDGRRGGRRAEHRHDGGALRRFRGVRRRMELRGTVAASRSTTTSRITRRRSARRLPACARRSRSVACGRSSSRARRPRAGGSFRTTSRARCRGPIG